MSIEITNNMGMTQRWEITLNHCFFHISYKDTDQGLSKESLAAIETKIITKLLCF